MITFVTYKLYKIFIFLINVFAHFAALHFLSEISSLMIYNQQLYIEVKSNYIYIYFLHKFTKCSRNFITVSYGKFHKRLSSIFTRLVLDFQHTHTILYAHITYDKPFSTIRTKVPAYKSRLKDAVKCVV